MKTATQWFDEYGVSHQNHTNKLIHWICVPAIFFSILGLLSAIPHQHLDNLVSPDLQPFVHYGTVVILVGMAFYFTMSWSIFIGMILISLGFLSVLAWLETSTTLHIGFLSLYVFILAWIGQFIGHKIEGAKPSFFKDVQFLLVGPAWLLGFVLKKLNIPY